MKANASNVDRLFDEGSLVVVSNRQPYSHEHAGNDISVARPVGGLTAGLDPVMRSVGGTWIAWGSGEADPAVVDADDHVEVPPDDPAYVLRRVWLDEAALEGYYYGFSNQVLWPLCHSFPSMVTYTRDFWRRYRQVNSQFATAVEGEACEQGSVIWFHDYHFGLAPGQVRQRVGIDALLVHFWHIPWPPWDVFRRCPHANELLTALLCNDVIGFQTAHDRRHFVRCAVELVGADFDPDAGAVIHAGRPTFVRAAPIPANAEAVSGHARSEAADTAWRSLSAEYGLADVRVALGVDRLDYTKGLEARLDALERLWEHYPEWQGELTYVQKASESRSRIAAYKSLQERVEARIDELNDRFGTADWTPVVYLNELLSRAELAGLYRHADVALVSPHRDGQNLVAKEYIAAQIDGDGVLVLSEAAGAAEVLGDDALTVTPLTTESFAATVRQALELPATERQRRMQALAAVVGRETTVDWLQDLFRPLVEPHRDLEKEDRVARTVVE